jgi:hypothetical protein
MTTAPVTPAASRQAAVDAALLVLKSMGLSLNDLTTAPGQRPAVPTFAEYVPVVSAQVTSGTLRAYGSYWKRVVEKWGSLRLDEPTPSDVRQFAKEIKENALRCLYNKAEDDGLIDHTGNPASKVGKPRRLPSTRRAIADTQLAEINQVAAATGDDPGLDADPAAAHRDCLPARRRPRAAPAGPGP